MAANGDEARVLTYLTARPRDAINDNMDAELLYRRKFAQPDGTLVEIVVWRVPTPTKGSRHSYKYRLFYGTEGRRIVGFDNERGKGDHIHIDGVEKPYSFSTVDKLIEDFFAEIERSPIK